MTHFFIKIIDSRNIVQGNYNFEKFKRIFTLTIWCGNFLKKAHGEKTPVHS